MRAKQWREGSMVIILLVIAVWLISLIWGLMDKARVAVTRANDVKSQYRVLEEQKAALQANVAALGTERGRDAVSGQPLGLHYWEKRLS